MNKFAERLKELREEKNLTQYELSKVEKAGSLYTGDKYVVTKTFEMAYELSKKVNISTACINRWEKNLRVPNIDSIITLCQFFGCSADYLIGLED